jgi:8-amino-3,8-dideoxy-alpha-D-manno-octulosonate transaminase
VDEFEADFARFVGAKHALAVTSGTGALCTALAALGVGPGQEVIVPAYMWVSVVAAVVNQGAIPVLADIDDTFCLNPASVAEKITPRTAGIVMVHMSGAPGNVHAILEVAEARNLWVLEDCVQCVGGSIGGRKVGTFGNMGIFSFQVNKNMTSGEGGCVVTDDERLYRRAFACHDMGYPRDCNRQLEFGEPQTWLWGKGVRLDELRAAILKVQLRKLPSIICAMRRSKYRIRQALAKYSHVSLRKIQDPAGDTACFLITTYPELLRAEGIAAVSPGISTIVMTDWGMHAYYNIPSLVHRTSVDGGGFPWNLAENRGLERNYAKGECPSADSLFERSILVAIPSCLTEEDEDQIILAFDRVLGNGV